LLSTSTIPDLVEARHAGIASGINNVLAPIGGFLVVAALGLIFFAAVEDRWDLPPAALAALFYWRIRASFRDAIIIQVHNGAWKSGARR
jgi:hypothetical protein